MKPLAQCVTDYFTALVIECEEKDKLAVRYLRESILEFLEYPGEKTADEVYNSFFDAFRMRKDGFTFFDILDALRSYEVQTSGLTDSQRDHFTHSIWVFLMGLGIYASNRRYRAAFCGKSYDFLYQWGLTALLHDIGYPVEITFNQYKKYIESMIDIDGDSNKPEPYFEYGRIDELLYLHNDSEKSCIRYLSENMAQALGLNAMEIAADLMNYPNIKGTSGYIDHAFYSAVMIMRWNGTLIEKSGLPQSKFSFDTVNAATAVLLHNYYKRPLQKSRKLPPLTVKQHPLAFMIILCDELQEWDRAVYGKKNNSKPIAEKCHIYLSEERLTVSYALSITGDAEGAAEKYSQSKMQTLTKLLSLTDIYGDMNQDFVTSSVDSERRDVFVQAPGFESPRPLLEHLEASAKIIHENYCKKYPGSPQGRLTWDECDDHFRYDNVSQVRHLFKYIMKRGYVILDSDKPCELHKVDMIDESIVEEFAVEEHDRWVKSKINDGWSYGKVRDNTQKLHPSIVPYEELSEGEKDKDRAPLIEFVGTLRRTGKTLYKLS